MRDTRALEREIASLPSQSLEELRARWSDSYGRPAPTSFRRKFLARALAHQMQVAAFGGLSEANKRKLRAVADSAASGTFDAGPIASRIKPGTKLVRTWHGETHTVMALEDGFSWKGKRYGSLSAIAKTITGTSWNGRKFFGLKSTTPTTGKGARQPHAQPVAEPSYGRGRRSGSPELGVTANG